MTRMLMLLLVLLTGCNENIREADLEHLNGYWEIAEVRFPDGSEKTYSVNTSVDFFEMKNAKGYRKKMHPNLTGTYRTSDDAEQFAIVKKGDEFLMQYSNGPNQWEEQLLEISENRFSVKNQEDITYIYHRFQPPNLIR